MSAFAAGESGFSTRQVHVGSAVPEASPRALPIHFSAGFTFESLDEAEAHFGGGQGFGYSRTGNPTVAAVEKRLASLESGSDAVLLASGQAAVVVALLGLIDAGGHIVSSNHIYEGTRGLLTQNLPRAGVTSDFVDDVADPDAWRAAIRPNTRALFAESISNARNDILDIAAISAVADEHGIPLIVDNTFATPYLVRPIEHGAAVVVHSASKFLSGHGTALGGVIVDSGRFDAARAGDRFPHLTEPAAPGAPSLWELHGPRARAVYLRDSEAPRLGPTPSALNAFFIGQGIETLSLRVERQSQNALAVARWLDERPEVASVDYVGLDAHPHHALGERYLRGGSGSVFTFTLTGGREAAAAFVEAVELFAHMAHLGDTRSLVLHPASTSHVFRTIPEREALGVFPGTLRVSIGIEDVSDILADLDRGLAAARAATSDAREGALA
ncbi:O-acetylhomoserine aminocarboxypropyltransferase/cysteine synthase family protein [Microbacterium sp. gxy059]|uniref:O-acetylhomoserine aminocarboxypropyltransferase/cysteine synthase family protein n=1 Tax=Microbacterium sp. gxy059 TaxID=2957199 RepID=UPI003D97EF67